MGRCVSCKNKFSNLRCENTATTQGFCGKHFKTKYRRLWYTVNDVKYKVNKISALWRGYVIRKRLQLAGLRGETVNSEDPSTLETKQSVHPLDYFSLTENGKLFWFDIRTIIRCLFLNTTPINPYTRQPIPIETRIRLRKIYMYRVRNNLPVSYGVSTRKTYDRWIEISQILVENGMPEIDPTLFTEMSRDELYAFISNILRQFISIDLPIKYVFWVQNTVNKFYLDYTLETHLSFVSTTILTILHHIYNPYPICTTIIACL